HRNTSFLKFNFIGALPQCPAQGAALGNRQKTFLKKFFYFQKILMRQTVVWRGKYITNSAKLRMHK
ncbi:MAG: hypothetical protein IJZ37_02985, partial [Clostridia bacterium]|nr:hypothetical protein [Clostridia bacterium]